MYSDKINDTFAFTHNSFFIMFFDNLPAGIDTHTVLSGKGALSGIGEMLENMFPERSAVIIADKTTWEIAGKSVWEHIEASSAKQQAPYVITDSGLSADWKYEQKLEKFLGTTDAVPIAVGSGVINDLTKLASYRMGRPYICVGTVASSDGYAAFGASIIRDGAKRTFECSAPRGILMDTDIIFRAPRHLTAAGYADLMAKITAGADWILADAAGAEPIDKAAFNLSQSGLKEIVSHFDINSERSIEELVHGLLQSGFAMQLHKSSRPASGTEHLFCHLWDVQNRKSDCGNVSHGFQVGIGILVSTLLYEELLSADIGNMDMEAYAEAWPSWERTAEHIKELFARDPQMIDACTRQTRIKYPDRKELYRQLSAFQSAWNTTRKRIEAQILPYVQAKRLLEKAGAPTAPEQIGISSQRLAESCRMLPYMRDRYTIVDLAVRLGVYDTWLEKINARLS